MARLVVRGGSWILHAGGRCAFRYAAQRDDRYDDLGFRLALRSDEPGPGAAEPPEPGKRG